MPRYWFKPKSYGYGAIPTCWQGWVVTFIAPAAFVFGIVIAAQLRELSNPFTWGALGAVLAVSLAITIFLSRKRTEGEWRWRWGV